MNCRNAYGQITNESSPLHQASELGYEESVRILLKAGANPNAINKSLHKPIDLAKA